MTKHTGASLLQKLKDGTITTDERRLLESWYLHYADQVEPFEDAEVFRHDLHDLRETFFLKNREPRKLKLWPRLAKAAAMLALAATAGFVTYRLVNKTEDMPPISYANDVLPGKQGATLTLSDGKRISLSDAIDGQLAQQAGVSIRKSKDGQLIYEIGKTAAGVDQYNTLATSKGETYQVKLPDGSMVWLNAASSLTYHPQLLLGENRKVKLSGEAYFEVAKDKKHPFIVETQGQRITVLGTRFNVNSYHDEHATTTTLLEGSVKIGTSSGQALKLRVGQQAQLKNNALITSEVNAEDAIAWKDGVFLLAGQDLETVMRQAARWYNVEVAFEDESIKRQVLRGSVSRFENISQLLEVLESTGSVHFKVKGRRITAIR
ncbi:FecR family protein [Pedobacter ureilyticus]|uniref:FecR family protein n=1 Tax=Pedobacter ureilyticus TaxID=1393051 RepID=A0ABW9J9U9_9SPHI|nr:FecR domain-containing protein [Pedobacter helvus]